LLGVAALVLVTAAVYGPVLRHGFVNFDDERYVTDNAHVLGGLGGKGLRWAATATHASNWHPLTWVSHMLDVELFGVNPAGHHFTSLLLHAVNAVLLFLVLKGMSGAAGRSALVAALFAVHPLHVESVAWVAERKDVLSACFWMLALGAYLRYVRKRGVGSYAVVLLAFLGGLMAKPMVVTLPFVFLLLDYWPLGRFSPGGRPGPDGAAGGFAPGLARSGLLLEKVPLLALSALSAAVTYLAQAKAGTLNLAVQPYPWLRISNALSAYLRYIGRMLFPADLAVFYPLPARPLPWWQAAAAGVLLAGVSLMAIRASRRRGYPVVGWLWYLGTLVPVIGLVQVGGQAMADRYTYLPLIGLFVVVSWGAWDLAGRRRGRRALATAAVAAIAVLAVAARAQVGYWRDGVTLFTRALQVTADNWIMHVNLGGEMLERGRFEEAVGHFREAVRIAPGNAAYHYKLGSALAAWGKNAEAALSYREAVRLNPDYREARNNLGSVLFELGREEEALGQFAQVLRIDPGSDLAHYNIAEIRRKQGQYAPAIEHYRAALRINPDLREARLGLDIALIQLAREQRREGASSVRPRRTSGSP
jgi:protein O-mannosyl-transferase